MHGSRRGLRLAICAGFYFTVLTALQWKLNGGLTKQTLISRRWFSKAVKITNVLEHVQQQSALSICETIKNVIVVQDDTKATLHNLINYGDQWVKLDDQTVRREPMYFLQSELDRVAGCTSTVHIRTSYESTSNSLFNGSLVSRKKNDRTIRVEGTADSRVTQGMLAILCRVRALVKQSLHPKIVFLFVVCYLYFFGAGYVSFSRFSTHFAWMRR